MATELEIRVTAELREIKAALAALRGDIAKVGPAANASAASARNLAGGFQQASNAAAKTKREALGVQGAVAGAVSQLKAMVGAIGVGAVVVALVRMADTATRLRGQLSLVTKSEQELKVAMDQTFAIAQRTRQGLESTANLYARIARTAKTGQGETLALTESINQAVALSFTTAQAAEAALFQLGQGLGSGTLRGEELNSVLEQTPRLAQAIAEGLVKLGKIKDPGGLRAYAKDNGIAAELVVKAIASQQVKLREEFAKLKPTVADAWTAIKNGMTKAVGDLNRATGATQKMAGWMLKAADYISQAGQVIQIFGIKVAQVAHRSAYLVGAYFKGAGEIIKATFQEAFNFVADKAAGMNEAVAKAYAGLPGGIGNLVADQAQAQADRIRSMIKATENPLEVRRRVLAETAAGVAEIDANYDALADAVIAEGHAAEAATEGTTEAAEDLGKAVGGVADQFALLKDAAERALADLDNAFEDGTISVRAYYAEKVRLQQASIDADIAAARADAGGAKTSSERAAALTQIVILERERATVAKTAARDQAKAEEELVDKLADVQTRLLALGGNTAEARHRELEKEFKDLLKRLGVEADQAGIDLVHKLINVEAAKAGLDELGNEFSKVTSAYGQLSATTAAQVSAGLLSNATAEKRMAEARTVALGQLQDQRTKVLALADAYGVLGPEAALQLQTIDQKIAELSISTEDWRGKIQDAATQSLTTFFKDMASGAVSAGDAVRNLAVNFSQALAAMAAEALAKKAIGAIFDLFTKDKGADAGGAAQVATAAAAGLAYSAPVTVAATALGAAGATIITGAAALGVSAAALSAAAAALTIANSIGAVAHSGGVVGEIAGAMRSLSPYAFIGAPRYHSGGVAGVGPGEVASVLQRGEEVITRNDPRHRYNGGRDAVGGGRGGPGLVTTPIVAIGDAAVADAMAGAHGEQVVLTHVRRNWGGLSRGGDSG